MKVEKPDDAWKKELSPEQFAVARQKGTERAFTGKYWDCHDDGTYHCVCCGAELFSSKDKYESGSGWPSFTKPAVDEKVGEIVDDSHGMKRTEVTCNDCGAHLGHVFPDGPGPEGFRYCINSASLDLKKS